MKLKARLAGHCNASTDWFPTFHDVAGEPDVEIEFTDDQVIGVFQVTCGRLYIWCALIHTGDGKYYAIPVNEFECPPLTPSMITSWPDRVLVEPS